MEGDLYRNIDQDIFIDGPYKGMTYAEVARLDPNYLLDQSTKNTDISSNISNNIVLRAAMNRDFDDYIKNQDNEQDDHS